MKGGPKYLNLINHHQKHERTGRRQVWHLKGKYRRPTSLHPPDLNSTPKSRTHHIGKFWVNLGVKGFRLDGAMHFYATRDTPISLTIGSTMCFSS